MKTNNKGIEHLQCGYEDNCKHKDCLKCPRRQRISISLTQAENCVVEDFGKVDIQEMYKQGRKAEVDLWQKLMSKLMFKIFRTEGK